ncbi:hypothetical protein [Actinomadura sp. NPDC048394]|uniref:hypothetical protein n=1 Tax=Actinomadura sp. NPDC048394 TaxID=3158223 RepID=UPI0033E1EDCC
MAAAVLAQASSAWDGWLVAAIVVVVVLAVLGAVHGVATPSPAVTTAAASACAVAAAALARRAWTALERIPAHRILEASARTGNVATAAVVMDPGALTWIIEDAHTGPVIWALTGADLALLGCASLLAALAGRPAVLGPLLVVQVLFGTAVAATFLLTARPRPH